MTENEIGLYLNYLVQSHTEKNCKHFRKSEPRMTLRTRQTIIGKFRLEELEALV